MYKCPNKDCSNKTLYGEAWVNSLNSDGLKSNTCSYCSSELIEQGIEHRSTPMINTRGCSGASNPFTH